MKKLIHSLKKHDIGLVDSQSGRVLKTEKAVDVSDELSLDADSEPLWLYYTTTAERGEIVQLRQGCASAHYFTSHIHQEKDVDSALSHWAGWTNSSKERLIELCLKYSQSRRNGTDHETGSDSVDYPVRKFRRGQRVSVDFRDRAQNENWTGIGKFVRYVKPDEAGLSYLTEPHAIVKTDPSDWGSAFPLRCISATPSSPTRRVRSNDSSPKQP